MMGDLLFERMSRHCESKKRRRICMGNEEKDGLWECEGERACCFEYFTSCCRKNFTKSRMDLLSISTLKGVNRTIIMCMLMDMCAGFEKNFVDFLGRNKAIDFAEQNFKKDQNLRLV